MNNSVILAGLDQFLNQAGSKKGLSREKEQEIALKYYETGSQEAAHELVVSHLPLVIKIAFQHRGYMIPLQDLIQEGTIGLMKAVKRFDPFKGYRLASFAFWWIRAYMRNFILNCWNLVKLGTTQAQRKLFFRIGDIGEHFDQESKAIRVRALAEKLNVKEDDVIEMEARVKAREWSLSEPIGEDADISAMDLLEDGSPNQEARLIGEESKAALCELTRNALKKLDSRELFIIRKRFMEDSPWTLQKLSEHFGTSRERMRQIQTRALGKLRKELSPNMLEMACA
jgi:RNA polymerase sigma-32 factor